ncbi:hypothetical protein FH972_027204 [Carpinus fangiana]|uniref:Disease resistance protein At4g27190-like leucine-rich repeats domain-containing protein n=1 Tax=Carpinus fangiana TaxID=176857 RepID=A0A5N6L6D4_9ROSI|nr:hypothetical protein FH972_027204 [Carpinus fangiana]
MLARFQSLEELYVGDCGSLQEVFEVQGINVKETQVVTTSVARCLTQLQRLLIVGCMELEEIVAEEEAEQPIAKFVFSRVTVLHLAILPRLEWFYPGVHTSEWPKLKNMLVACCPKDEIFASELSSFQDILGQSQVEIPIKQPLFLVDDEVPFPSLEKLRIICMANLKIIWHNQFTANSFCEPQAVKVELCENLIDNQETCDVTATQLKELHLFHLPKLKHIWNKDPQVIFSFQNPLEVHDMVCERTESPFPGADQEGIPVNWMVNFDDQVAVKEIGLMYQNSGVSPKERMIEIGSY